MEDQKITAEETVMAIDGISFDAKLHGLKMPLTSCKDFHFFYFKRKADKPIQYLIECRCHNPATKVKCGKLMSNLKNFIRHLRSHGYSQ